MGAKTKRKIITILAYCLAILAVILTLFPILWIFGISIKTQRDAFAMPPVFIFKPIWSNYEKIWQTAGFAIAFRNSIIVTSIGVFLDLLIGVHEA
jgi:ABC-type glycerol-3-phosphate transport system permease component